MAGPDANYLELDFNRRYALVPRHKTSANALAAMRALSLINVALGTLVVALVSLFALLDPK